MPESQTSSRMIISVLEVFDRRGYDVAGHFEALDVDYEAMRRQGERLRWGDIVGVLRHLSEWTGGPAGFSSVGEALIFSPAFARVALMMSHLADPWQLYRVLKLWLAPSMVPIFDRKYDESSDGTIRMELTVPPGELSSPEYFYMLTGIYRHLPTLINAPDARVEADISERHAAYVITPPPADPKRRLQLQRNPTSQLATEALKELIEQQVEITRSGERLRRTINVLNERTQRLETFGRISQTLAEELELTELVRSILSIMLLEFGFEGGLIHLELPGDSPQRWGMGRREGQPLVSYPFTNSDTYRGRIEVWGPASYRIGGSDDPVAAVMPWLALAMDNAVAFRNLEAEKERSEENLRKLEVFKEALEARETKYRLLVEDASDAIGMFELATGRFVEVNEAMARLLGYRREELLQMAMRDIIEPNELRQQPFGVDKLRNSEVVRSTRTAVTKTGETLAVEAIAKRIDADHVQMIARDVTRWKRAEEQLRESEERYALAVRGANDGLWDWNLRTGDIYLSPRWKRMLGYEEDELGANPDEWFSRVHPDDIGQLEESVRLHLEAETENFAAEHRIRHRDGSWLWMLTRGVAVRNEEGVAYRMAGSQTDITERKAFEARLFHNAFHDSLTGLPNRAWCYERIETLLDPEGEQAPFALLYFDLDRFKVINDSLGHGIGDRILVRVAERLERVLTHVGRVARIGGDEFIVLLEDIDNEDSATQAGALIIRSVQEAMHIDGREIVLSCSVGIALSTDRSYSIAEEIVRDADIAMYEAKATGRSRCQRFTTALHERAIDQMRLEVALRQAIEGDELELHYQPIVCTERKRIVAWEALARWPRPGHEPITPGRFIPLAEETGLIHGLGRWVLEAAARQIIAWRDDPAYEDSLSVSVNLSPAQFRRPDIVDEVKRVIEQYELPAKSMSLEITESALIEDSGVSIDRIVALRETGVRVVIDDFGVGYSSLSYLVRLPVDMIKIDRSFIRNIERERRRYDVVAAVIQLADRLDLRTVVEGVETEEQFSLLTAISSRLLLQGSLFSMPAPVRETGALLQQAWPRASKQPLP